MVDLCATGLKLLSLAAWFDESVHLIFLPMAFENSETKTHVTAESAISSLEYQPQTFRTQLASRRPGLTRNIFAMSVVLTVLTFFITACAHHLKSYKNANTSSRKLAHQVRCSASAHCSFITLHEYTSAPNSAGSIRSEKKSPSEV